MLWLANFKTKMFYEFGYMWNLFLKKIITLYYIVTGKIGGRQSQGNISKADCENIIIFSALSSLIKGRDFVQT